MKKFLELFKKAGGLATIKDYIRSNVFFLVLFQFLILGPSRKALEIVRLSTQLKIQKRLRKKYVSKLEKFSYKEVRNREHIKNKTVWICWLQGIENAPDLVKVCYESVCKNLKGWNIVVVTSKNMYEYTDIPSYIIEKWNKGIISNTHFSDILRVELLARHGGLWLDSTVLCTGSIPNYIEESEFFIYQCLKPGLDGHCIVGSSWLIYSESNNVVMCAVRLLLFEYWKSNNRLIDYFLFHHFMSITLEYFKEEWNKIPKVPNDLSHILLLQLFNSFDEEVYNHVKQFITFHKLSYKRNEEDMTKKNTFYDVIITEKKY